MRPAREAVAPAVGQGILLEMESEQPRIVIPDPETAGLGRTPCAGPPPAGAGAIGPPVPLAAAATSLRWAETAVQLIKKNLLPQGEVLHCTERTGGAGAPAVPGADRRGRPPLPRPAGRPRPDRGEAAGRDPPRLIETPGGAPEVAQRLGIHPQTARYRLRQIRECGAPRSTTPTSASRCCWCSARSGSEGPGAGGRVAHPLRVRGP
ncbi:PucR family transcriptional regulator OS=Streptomyces violarus OX=67380 GN=FHS41_003362 PE=3 SV=1 [Streptomyces violarus]